MENSKKILRSNCDPTPTLNSQSGYALILFITLLPVIMASLTFLFCSQYLTKNWSQSFHICRSELFKVQTSVAQNLEQLLKLNSQAKSLRVALGLAQAKLAFAMVKADPLLIAAATKEISKINKQKKQLDIIQKSIINHANLKLKAGTWRVTQKLKKQNSENQISASSFMKIQISPIKSISNRLAVVPDNSDLAPVYELKNPFSDNQMLSVSWKTYFETGLKGEMPWLQNRYQKVSSCTVTLRKKDNKFLPQIRRDKF